MAYNFQTGEQVQQQGLDTGRVWLDRSEYAITRSPMPHHGAGRRYERSRGHGLSASRPQGLRVCMKINVILLKLHSLTHNASTARAEEPNAMSGHPVGNFPSTSVFTPHSTRSLERAPLILLAIVQPLLVRDHQLQIGLVQVEDHSRACSRGRGPRSGAVRSAQTHGSDQNGSE